MRANSFSACSSLSVALLASVAVAACAQSESDTGSDSVAASEAPLVVPSAPYVGTWTQGSIPALPDANGTLGPVALMIGSGGIHEGKYSNGADLSLAPLPTMEDWFTSAAKTSFSCAPNFEGDLRNANNDAVAFKSMLGMNTGSAFDLFGIKMPDSQYPGAVAYRPDRARWLRSEWGRRYISTLQPYEALYSYASPGAPGSPASLAGVSELRNHGGRMYCAAVEMQQRQNSRKIAFGTVSPYKLSFFGHEIDLVSVTPTVSMMGPKQEDDRKNNGSQAFVIPIAVGNVVHPLKGLLPDGIGEVKAPVVFVTGDSEVVTSSNLSPVVTSSGTFVRFRKQYETMTHADAIVHAHSAEGSGERSLTFFKYGPFEAKAVMGVKVGYGNVDAEDTRLINKWSDQGVPLGSVRPQHRTGRQWGTLNDPLHYNDGNLRRYSVNSYNLWWIDPNTLGTALSGVPLGTLNVDLLRESQNNDRHITSSAYTTIEGGIKGELSFSYGPLDLSVSATGTLGATVTQKHDIRDAVFYKAEDGSIPVRNTSIIVRPRTDGNAFLALKLHIYMGVNLGWLGHHTIVNKDFNTDKDLGTWSSEGSNTWGVSQRMEIGYGSPLATDVSFKKQKSYLATDSSLFTTFPGGQGDIDACLTQEPVLPDPPADCAPPKANTSVPSAQFCLYAPIEEGIDCNDPDGQIDYKVDNEDQHKCVVDYFHYLCKGKWQRDNYKSEYVQSHLLYTDAPNSPEGQADQDLLKQVTDTCANAYTVGMSEMQRDIWVAAFFRQATCDESANLLDEANLVDMTVDDGGNPVSTPASNSCP